jgi:nucleoside-diphosphate-sugar epimerase
MHALISGATGFVGSHLADYLHAQGSQVSCLVRPTSDRKWIKEKPYARLEVDYFNVAHLARAMKDVTHVFHCAGVITAADEREFYRGNCGATRNLLLAAKNMSGQIKKFVHVSSLAAVGPAEGRTPLDESAPCRPVSEYGRTKLLAEEEVLKAKEELPVTVIRPPTVYGTRDTGLQVVYRIVNRGMVPRVGAQRLMSLVSVQDLARALARAAVERAAEGQVYFVADESVFTFDQIVRVAARALDRKIRWVNVSPFVAGGIMGGLASVFSLLGVRSMITKDKAREVEQRNWICSGRKFAAQFNMPTQVKMEEGLAETVRWYRDQGLL